jgi:thiamine kinase-like enzyme
MMFSPGKQPLLLLLMLAAFGETLTLFLRVDQGPSAHEVTFRRNLIQELAEVKREMADIQAANFRELESEITLRGEILQDLVEIKNEMKRVKEHHVKSLDEVKFLLRALADRSGSSVGTERTLDPSSVA